MDERTRGALNAINRDFYDLAADEFSATRNHPWPGWKQVMQEVAEGTLRVLDVGCGNGRFAAFLGAQWAGPLDYLGLDASAALLANAQRLCDAQPGLSFQRRDLLAAEFRSEPPAGPFDLIAVFGVMHHVPSFEARRELLNALGARLAPGGVLALTLWRFAASERFDARQLAWSTYNDEADEPVDTRQLEPGDHLVRWGTGQDVPRYCHFSDDAETERLIESVCSADPGLRLAHRFRADGRSGDLNDYLLFRRLAP